MQEGTLLQVLPTMAVCTLPITAFLMPQFVPLQNRAIFFKLWNTLRHYVRDLKEYRPNLQMTWSKKLFFQLLPLYQNHEWKNVQVEALLISCNPLNIKGNKKGSDPCNHNELDLECTSVENWGLVQKSDLFRATVSSRTATSCFILSWFWLG